MWIQLKCNSLFSSEANDGKSFVSSWTSFGPCDNRCKKSRQRFCSNLDLSKCPNVNENGVEKEFMSCTEEECYGKNCKRDEFLTRKCKKYESYSMNCNQGSSRKWTLNHILANQVFENLQVTWLCQGWAICLSPGNHLLRCNPICNNKGIARMLLWFRMIEWKSLLGFLPNFMEWYLVIG